MSLGDLMSQLDLLGDGIGNLKKKYQYFIERKGEGLYTEERFVYSELEGILQSLEEVQETVNYLNKNVFVEGRLETVGGKFYVGGYQLKEDDCIEVLLEKDWMRTDVSLIKGEYYVDLLGKTMEDVIFARVRA